jgi:hypothetical protein
VIAAGILGAAAVHRYDQPSRPATPEWTRACRAAIDATARLQQLEAVEIDQAMRSTWGAIAGVRVQPRPTLASDIARLKREADGATQNCLAPRSGVTGAEANGWRASAPVT